MTEKKGKHESGITTTKGGQRVAVVNEWGDVGTVPAEVVQSGQYLDAGYQLATPEQVKESQYAEKYGDTTAAVRAFAEGGARGLTLGASDWAMRQLGVEAEGLRERQARNPLAAGMGEFAGVVAPALMTGGAGGLAEIFGRGGAMGAAKGLTRAVVEYSPAAIVARGGRAAESGLARLMGGGMGAKVGAATIVGAGEGAIYGAGQALSEASLGDYDLTAENLLASMKTGAVLGGAAGGLLTAGGPLAKKATQKFGESLKITPALLNKKVSKESLDEFISNTAFQAAKGPGAGKKFVERVKRQFGEDGITEVGRVIRDEGVITPLSTLDDVAAISKVKAQQWGQQIGNIVKQLDDEAAISYRPTIKKISQRIETDVLSKLEGSRLPDLQRMGDTVRRRLDPFLLKDMPDRRMAFSDLHGMRAELDDLIYRTDRASPVIEELRKARSIVEDELTTAADRAAKSLGSGMADTYRVAKKKYAALKTVSEMAEDGASRLDANRNFSLTDMMVGTAFGIGDVAASGDIDPGTLAMAFIAGRLHRMVRTRGATALAAGLDQASKAVQLTALKRSSDDIVSKVSSAAKQITTPATIKQKVRQVAVPTATTQVPVEETSLKEKYDAKVKQHSAIIDNPMILQDRVANTMGNAAYVAPNTMLSITQTANRAAEFIKSKMPTPPVRPSDITAHLDTRQRVSDSQMAKFLRYAEVVEDPKKALDDMSKGKITREGAEAFRTVYPKMFAELEKEVFSNLANAKEALPYENLIHLSILLNRPLHPSLEPTFIYSMQEMHKKNREERQPPQAKKVPDMAKSQASRSQELA